MNKEHVCKVVMSNGDYAFVYLSLHACVCFSLFLFAFICFCISLYLRILLQSSSHKRRNGGIRRVGKKRR